MAGSSERKDAPAIRACSALTTSKMTPPLSCKAVNDGESQVFCLLASERGWKEGRTIWVERRKQEERGSVSPPRSDGKEANHPQQLPLPSSLLLYLSSRKLLDLGRTHLSESGLDAKCA